MSISKFNPPNKEVFWCSECDCMEVDSTDPKTGTFYIVFGHQYIPPKCGQPLKTADCVGDYHPVILAFCKKCDYLKKALPKPRKVKGELQ